MVDQSCDHGRAEIIRTGIHQHIGQLQYGAQAFEVLAFTGTQADGGGVVGGYDQQIELTLCCCIQHRNVNGVVTGPAGEPILTYRTWD